MARFLHTADWQIGRHSSLSTSSPGSRSRSGRFSEDDAALLAQARFDAIERIAALASAEKVDAVLVAGDVFDAQTVSDRTLHRTFQLMKGYSGPWILIPGNHDAALAESVWTRARRLNAIPPNVHALLAPEVRVFTDAGFAVLPAPLTQRQTYQDLTDWFDGAETPAGLLRIGLAHGSVSGQLPESADSPNPIAPTRVQSARLDYLALGDWHGCKQIDSRTWYSGTPEQDRFKDNNAGHVLIVDIAAPGAEPAVTLRPVGQHQWIKREATLTVASDLDNLLAELAQLPDKSVVDLTLRVQIELLKQQRLLQGLSGEEARLRSLQYQLADLRLHPTDADIAELHADGYVGEVVQTLRDMQENSSTTDTAREALAILTGLLQQSTGQSAGEASA